LAVSFLRACGAKGILLLLPLAATLGIAHAACYQEKEKARIVAQISNSPWTRLDILKVRYTIGHTRRSSIQGLAGCVYAWRILTSRRPIAAVREKLQSLVSQFSFRGQNSSIEGQPGPRNIVTGESPKWKTI
jgi:hypothetical protein